MKLLLCFLSIVALTTAKLLLVYQIGRHGARSDKESFEGILINEEENFIVNKESLTRQGLFQTYARGLGINTRYYDLLKNSELKQVRVRASNTTRTIFSAYAQLLGMFGSNDCRSSIEHFTRYDKTKEINTFDDLDAEVAVCLNKYIPKVEVHKKGDATFQIWRGDCLLVNDLTCKDTRTDEIQNKINLYDFSVSEWSSKFYPVLKKEQNLKFCHWMVSITGHHLKMNESLFDEDFSLQRITQLCLDYEMTKLKEYSTKTTVLWRLQSSELLKDIIHAFDDTIDNHNNDHESSASDRIVYYFDSGHDTNLLALLRALGIDQLEHLPFSSSLFFELHEDDINQKFFVKVFLNDKELDMNVFEDNSILEDNSSDPPQKELEMNSFLKEPKIDEPDQDSSYYFYLKRYLLRRVLTEDVESYCDKKSSEMEYVEHENCDTKASNSHIMIFVVLSSTLIFFIAVFVVFIIIKKSKIKILPRVNSVTERGLKGDHFEFHDEVFEIEDQTTNE